MLVNMQHEYCIVDFDVGYNIFQRIFRKKKEKRNQLANVCEIVKLCC